MSLYLLDIVHFGFINPNFGKLFNKIGEMDNMFSNFYVGIEN